MNIRQKPLIPSLLFATFFVVASPPCFADDSIENTELAMIIRQLEWIQNIAHHKANTLNPQPSRYVFDYQKLSSDIKHIQRGIYDYLSPKRAQPRDLTELSGDYQKEKSAIDEGKKGKKQP